MTIRVGIAGYGILGELRRGRFVRRLDVKTVAICDQSFAKSGEVPDGVRFY